MNQILEINNLCRVCSTTGLHSLHSPIPVYLHSDLNECSHWTKTIAVLIEEVTGLGKIHKDDGLPQKICTICVSYLKHAVNFRQQVLSNSDRIKPSILTNSPNLQCRNASPIITEKFCNSEAVEKFYPINETNINKEEYDNLKAELDLFFGDNNDMDSDDESDDEQTNGANEYHQNRLTKSDTIKTAIHNFFNYTEKSFEEDDLSDFHRISVNQPDDYKERKCHACKCRFMLLESYQLHMKECIQAKLVNFITDCQQLLIFKKHKAISAAEFLRRGIFSLKNIVKSLALSYQVITKKQCIKNTNPDVTKNDNIWTKDIFHIDNQLFQPSKNILGKNNTLLKPLKVLPKRFLSSPVRILPKINNVSTPKTPSFVAKCSTCRLRFNAIDELEMHNRNMHNASRGRTSISSNRSSDDSDRLMSILMDSDTQEGIVDVLKLRQRSPNIVNIELNSAKNLM